MNSDLDTAIDFFRLALPPLRAPAVYVSGRITPAPAVDFSFTYEQIARATMRHGPDSPAYGTYFCHTSRFKELRRGQWGTAGECVDAVSIILDWDSASPWRNSDQKLPSIDTLRQALALCPLEPSWVVSTGYGLQWGVRLTETIPAKSYGPVARRIQRWLSGSLTAQGFQMDEPFAPTRIWRAPIRTWNHKDPNNPVEVRLEQLHPKRSYDLDDLLSLAPELPQADHLSAASIYSPKESTDRLSFPKDLGDWSPIQRLMAGPEEWFSARYPLLDVLLARGWEVVSESSDGTRQLCRPGKTSGISGVQFPDGSFISNTTSTEIPHSVRIWSSFDLLALTRFPALSRSEAYAMARKLPEVQEARPEGFDSEQQEMIASMFGK